jgi:RNA 3'-terminal phosphate cyclase (ATP)
MDRVLVDGSKGEGGGQILRTSLALACITGKGLRIENIRAARRNPGLAKQHLTCVQAAREISDGQCHGATLRSKVLDFEPGTVQGGSFQFDIGSAGSASLVAQTVLPALFLAEKPSRVTVAGGTHNPLAPPFDFLRETFLPAIASGGFEANCELLKHGFFPAGGGKIMFDVQPWQKPASGGRRTIDLCEPDDQIQICARIYTAKLPAHIAQRQEKLLLESNLDIQDVEHMEVTDSVGPGNCVMIRFCGPAEGGSDPVQRSALGRITVFTAFGMRGKPSHKVVGEVVSLAKDFLASGAAVDRFLADQLLIYMAISKTGCYTTNELSSHLLTNIDIIKKLLPVEFTIDECNKAYRITCRPG